MIVDVYLLEVSTEGRREAYELRVNVDTNSTLVSVICDAWMSRNKRKRLCDIDNNCKPFSFMYSELADYESRQSVARQGFCIRLSDSHDSILHLNDQLSSRSILHAVE